MREHAAEIMSKRITTVQLTDSVRKAYQLMHENRFRHLPVTDEAGRVVGILSDRDLCRAMTPKRDGAIEFEAGLEVKDFMSWPVRAVAEETLIGDVAKIMLVERISALVVLRDGDVPCGILTTDDVLRFLVELLEKDPSAYHLSLGSIFGGDILSYGGAA